MGCERYAGATFFSAAPGRIGPFPRVRGGIAPRDRLEPVDGAAIGRHGTALTREASCDGARARSEGYGQSQWGFGAQFLGRVRPKGVWGRAHSGASAGRRW